MKKKLCLSCPAFSLLLLFFFHLTPQQQKQKLTKLVSGMGISFRKILDSLFGTREMRVSR